MKRILFVLAGMAFLLQGCYVGFRHPEVKDHKWGEVSHMDDCTQCHQNWRPEPVLPDGAVDDGWWDFYTRSAWWQEKAADDFFGSSSVAPTAARPGSRSAAPPIQQPVTTSTGVGSLGKSNTDTDNETIDRKRSSGSRRSTTQKEGRSGRSRSSRRSTSDDENE